MRILECRFEENSDQYRQLVGNVNHEKQIKELLAAQIAKEIMESNCIMFTKMNNPQTFNPVFIARVGIAKASEVSEEVNYQKEQHIKHLKVMYDSVNLSAIDILKPPHGI